MKDAINRWIWLFWVGVFRTAGLILYLSPPNLPKNEGQKLRQAAINHEVVIIFNSGGWGDTSLERADDFTPVLKGIKQAIDVTGYRSTIVPYTRTLSSFLGRIAGAKEQFNSFKYNSRIMVDDIRFLVESFPEKRFIIAGFSTGGALTSRAMKSLDNLPNVYGISVGVPGWFYTYRSGKSLLLDNSGGDPICAGNANAIAMAVFKSPAKWIAARKNGRKLSFALAIQIPHHEYSWSSPEVGIPITRFLEAHFKSN